MSSNTNRVWAGALCALALIGQQAVRAQEAKPDAAKPDDKPVTMTQSGKVGDAVRYKSTIVVDIGGNEITVEQTRKHIIKEIKDNKDVEIVMESEGGKFVANGADNEIPAGSPITVTRDKANKVLTFKPKVEDNPYLSSTTQHLLAYADHIVFPDKPVKPGDSWTTEIDNPQVKGKKVTIKTTYVSADKAEDVAVWKIKQTVEADTEVADSKLKAETTATLDAANGQLVEAEQTVKGVPGQMGPVDWKSKLKRLKAEPEKAEKKAAAP
jgi:hypothetical protein